jgi:glc operon protein GlcG
MYIHKVSDLSIAGARVVLRAAVSHAEKMGVPQCVAIVDRGGNLLAFERMEGAKLLSQHSAIQKAITAASHRTQTGTLPAELGVGIALATGLRYAPIAGGLPIIIDSEVVGAIGVGSGSDEEDIEVAQVAIDALKAVLAEAK